MLFNIVFNLTISGGSKKEENTVDKSRCMNPARRGNTLVPRHVTVNKGFRAVSAK